MIDYRFFPPPHGFVAVAAQVQGFKVICFQFEAFGEVSEGFGMVFETVVSIAAVVPGFRVERRQLNDLGRSRRSPVS